MIFRQLRDALAHFYRVLPSCRRSCARRAEGEAADVSSKFRFKNRAVNHRGPGHKGRECLANNDNNNNTLVERPCALYLNYCCTRFGKHIYYTIVPTCAWRRALRDLARTAATRNGDGRPTARRVWQQN